MSHKIEGRHLVFQTTQEANAFLRKAKRAGSFEVFSSTVKAAAAIRKKEQGTKKLNTADKHELCCLYHGVMTLATYAEKKLFRQVVPEREIASWFDHVADVLGEKINDTHWTKTGTLSEHDNKLVGSFSAMLNQPLPAVMTYEDTKILKIFSSMMISSKLPSSEIPRDSVLVGTFHVIMFGLMASGIKHFDNTWSPERVFKKLEAAGILEQYIRCAAVPSSNEEICTFKKHILRALLCSTALLRKSFGVGTPCGDTLRAIVANPKAICSHTRTYLDSLVRLSDALQIGLDDDVCWCEYCKKPSPKDTIMKCGRCKQVFYCSKLCQKADWKEHKKICEAPKDKGHAVVSTSAIMEVLQLIHVDLMVELVHECDKAGGGAKMKDFLVELDLSPDENGRIPLLRDRPRYKIVPIAKYLDGTRPAELLQKGRGVVDLPNASPKDLVTALKKRLACKEAETDLICLEMHPPVWVYTFHQLIIGHLGRPVITQRALDAFRIAMYNNDFSGLIAIFEDEEIVGRMKPIIREAHMDLLSPDGGLAEFLASIL